MASNNIRRLGASGHMTVLDHDRPGKLKIIKKLMSKEPVNDPNAKV